MKGRLLGTTEKHNLLVYFPGRNYQSKYLELYSIVLESSGGISWCGKYAMSPHHLTHLCMGGRGGKPKTRKPKCKNQMYVGDVR